MTTKSTAEKRDSPVREGTMPSQEDLRAAYQIHTLAQMMVAQLVATHPWMQQLAYTQPFVPWNGTPASFCPTSSQMTTTPPWMTYPMGPCAMGQAPMGFETAGITPGGYPLDALWSSMCSCPPTWR